jgi:hypothetical protein
LVEVEEVALMVVQAEVEVKFVQMILKPFLREPFSLSRSVRADEVEVGQEAPR